MRAFARDVARVLIAGDECLTLEVPPYAVRPRPQAPVAVPLAWDELSDASLAPDGWTIHTIFERLDGRGDPWEDIARAARPLGRPARAWMRSYREGA